MKMRPFALGLGNVANCVAQPFAGCEPVHSTGLLTGPKIAARILAEVAARQPGDRHVAATLPLDRLFALHTELDALEERARLLQLEITAVLIGAAAEAVKDEMERHCTAPFASMAGTA